MLSITLEFVGFIVKDHDAGSDKGVKLARVFPCEFVRFGCVRITIPLWGSWGWIK